MRNGHFCDNNGISRSNPVCDAVIISEQKVNWLVVFAGFFVVFTLYGAYYCFGVFLKPMLAELGWTRAVTTGVISVYMLVHGLFSIVMGFLSDRFGPKQVVGLSIFIVGIGYCLCSQIYEIWHLYIYFGLIVGIGMGASYVPSISAVTKWFIDKRGLALGIVAAGVGVGQMVFPPLMKNMITLYGWRMSFLFIGVIVFVIGIPAALFLSHPRIEEDFSSSGAIGKGIPNSVGGAETQVDRTVWESLGTGLFWLLLSLFIAQVFVVSMVTTHLVAHIEDIGVEPILAAGVLTLIGGGGILGRVIMGGFADKVTNKELLFFCIISLMFLLFGLNYVRSLWVFYLFSFCFGFSS